MRSRRLLARLSGAFAIGLLTAAPTVVHAQPALSFTSQSGVYLDGWTRMIGWQFSVPAAVNVSALGWFDAGQDGLNRAHEVGIWNSSTQALLASAIVPQGTAGTLVGQFRWTDLFAPVTLQPGTTYRIAGLDIGSGGDGHVWDASGYGVSITGFAVDPAITLGAPGTALGGLASQFSYPTGVIGDARRVLMGPNLQLSQISTVPEPASVLLFGAGAAVLLVGAARRRVSSGR